MAAPDEPGQDAGGEDAFITSLMDTDLYSLGALFSDEHPDLVEDVVEQAETMEEIGLAAFAEREEVSVEECFQTLLTGLALRYYRAVSG